MVSHGSEEATWDMATKVLILAGTSEARALAEALSARKVAGVLSYAGRVEQIMPTSLPHRIGGFGGVDGLVNYLRTEGISHVIDATHPFAAQMSLNAVLACEKAGVPLLALTRPSWQPEPGDRWILVPDIAGAVHALERPPSRVFLAIGRQNLAAFAARPEHHYLVRLVDPPQSPLPLPRVEVVIDRGPFDRASDQALMERHGIALVVAKNAGGSGAYAKIEAARALGLPVVMISRPALPAREEVHTIEAALLWLARHGVDLGV